ncbi:hypothetical protein [Microcoleus sp. CAWBG640]
MSGLTIGAIEVMVRRLLNLGQERELLVSTHITFTIRVSEQ